MCESVNDPSTHALIQPNDKKRQQMAWVGTAEANPDETPLPFPPELRFTAVSQLLRR